MSSVMRGLPVVVSWTLLVRSGTIIPNIRAAHLRQDAGLGSRKPALKHCLKSGDAGASARLCASRIRRGVNRGVELRDIGVVDPQRVELHRQLHEVFPVGAENALSARNDR